MKNLYFEIGHRDLVGGGQLALQNLATALQSVFNVHLSTDFHPGMDGYEYIRPPREPFKIGMPGQVDVHLASHYTELPKPKGRLNVFYCLFPRPIWNLSGYQHVVTISEYSREHIRARWKRESEILVGGAFAPDYAPAPFKENVFLSCSRFFMEGDPDRFWGHSKNQHIVIKAFKTLPRDVPWKLALAGSVLTGEDGRYLDACRRLAGDDSRIQFFPMAGKDEVRSLYSRAKVFIHAMGYGRSDLAETEHFGICVQKALLSGCFSIGHRSGNLPRICHRTFSTPDVLAQIMAENCADKELDKNCNRIAMEHAQETFEKFEAETQKVFGRWA